MTFGFDTALKYLKDGKLVRRKVWAEGRWLRLVSPSHPRPYFQIEVHLPEPQAFDCLWHMTDMDLLAEDWKVKDR